MRSQWRTAVAAVSLAHTSSAPTESPPSAKRPANPYPDRLHAFPVRKRRLDLFQQLHLIADMGIVLPVERDVRDLLHQFRDAEVRQGTVEDATRGLKVERFAFAHFNVTGYDSTSSALGYVFNHLSPGGIIALSQYGANKRESVKDAVGDYLKGRTDYWLFRLPTLQALLMRV
jgi:hypothetical protein